MPCKNTRLLALFPALFFCFLVFIGACLWCLFIERSPGSYALVSISYLSLFALYCVGVLGYKVGGSSLSLEEQVHTLEGETEKLKTVATELVKSIWLANEGAGKLDGGHIAIIKMMKDCAGRLESFVGSDVLMKLNEDLKNEISMFEKLSPTEKKEYYRDAREAAVVPRPVQR